jgi:hypothetical protein
VAEAGQVTLIRQILPPLVCQFFPRWCLYKERLRLDRKCKGKANILHRWLSLLVVRETRSDISCPFLASDGVRGAQISHKEFSDVTFTEGSVLDAPP